MACSEVFFAWVPEIKPTHPRGGHHPKFVARADGDGEVRVAVDVQAAAIDICRARASEELGLAFALWQIAVPSTFVARVRWAWGFAG